MNWVSQKKQIEIKVSFDANLKALRLGEVYES